jgi:diguanylate cyclase (GGDEF)-like protein
MAQAGVSRRLTAVAKSGSSIRFRIVALAIVAVAPLIFDRVRLLEAGRTEKMAAAQVQTLELARTGVDKQEDILSSVRSVLQTVSHAIDRVPADGRECNRLTSDVASDVDGIRAIFVVNQAGRVTCASNPSTVGIDVADRSYFRQALRDGGFVVSGLIYPRSGREPGIVVAYGRRGPSGQVETVLGAMVDLRWTAQLTAVVEQRPGTLALLVAHDGTVLAAQPTPVAWIGRDLSQIALVREAQTRGQGTTTATAFDGMRRIWGFLAVPNAGAHVLIGMDERLIVSSIEREVSFSYIQLTFIVLLVLIGAWAFGAHAILRPIRALARQAERIGRGDLSVRTGRAQWAPEFRPLTHALDSMAARLALRENSLRTESERFRELATVDSLTGLSNRRAFDTCLDGEWARASADRTPVALLMIDVDYFKRYNDHYGHLAGDACLRAIASILSAASVADQRAARFGGEEFSMLLPGARTSEAAFLAENIRRTVEDLAIPHVGAPSGVVTVSIGAVSLMPGRGANVEALIAAADAALYASKHGRNTVTVYAPAVLAQAS